MSAPTLIDNLNQIASIKSDIKSAIENKGVDMTGLSFADYPGAISSIQTGGTFVTETLNVSVNNTYYPGQGVDGFSQVVVDVPQTGWTDKDVTEKAFTIINLNNSASYVANQAFQNKTDLQTVYLPNCTSVGTQAFFFCRSLTTVSLPVCRIISISAFMNCTFLTQVSLPVCTNIGNGAFSSCTRLNSLTLCTDAYWTIPYQGNMLSRTPIMSGTGSIYVRSDTYSLWIASTGWSSLSNRFVSVETSDTLLGFSEGTVYGTTKLLYENFNSFIGVQKNDIVSVSLPNCNVIGTYVFRDCLSLLNVYLPECNVIDGVATPFSGSVNVQKMNIGLDYLNNSNTFLIPSSLKELELPRCSYIGKSAFFGYISLTQVSLPVCTSIGNKAFYHCSSLESLSLPVCSYIGDGTFFGCISLTSINLPVCESIGDEAFLGCSSLSQIELPVCSYIGNMTFDTYSSIVVTLGYSDVCVLGGSSLAFNFSGSIYVPSSLVDAYKSAQYWSAYASQIFPISE